MTDRFSNFADLAEHYAREIATPDYAAAFMEQTELAKLSIEHEPSAAVNGHNSLQSATNAHCRQLTEFTATAFIQRSSNSH